MKKPVVDYRAFRLSRLNEPQFAHLKLLGGWIIYFLLYLLTENLIPPERCTSVHCWIDDVIPFCEWFLLPYCFWYVAIVFSLVYFALYDVDSFKKLCRYTFIVQMIACLIYIIFPTRQDLRPAVFPRDNLLTWCIAIIYAVDTSTGVCPSMHVAISIAMASVWLRKRDVPKGWKAFISITTVLICLSTMFIKQHSALDSVAALPLCLIAETVVFRKEPPERTRHVCPSIHRERKRIHAQINARRHL